MAKNKILHVLGALLAGGAERAAVELLLEMKRRGAEVELLCLTRQIDAVGLEWKEALSKAGVPVFTSSARRAGPRQVMSFAWRLMRSRPHLVHLHLPYTERTYYLARFLARGKLHALRKLPNMKAPSGRLTSFALRHSDVGTSVAGGVSTYEAYQGKLRGNLYCVPNGRQLDWPLYDPSKFDVYRSQLGLAPDSSHFVHVGTMFGDSLATAQKAHDTLIAAWRKAALPNAELHLLGSGNLLPDVTSASIDLGTVKVHGTQTNIYKWLLACDAFILPSRWEGLPNAGIEAAATGIPCIFSDIPPCHELKVQNARYCEVDDVDALANTLGYVVAHHPSLLPDTETVKEVRVKYSIERAASDYLGIYSEILGEV